MGSMEYCLFENTGQELNRCLDKLKETDFSTLSDSEKRWGMHLIRKAAEIVQGFGHIIGLPKAAPTCPECGGPLHKDGQENTMLCGKCGLGWDPDDLE